MSGLKSMGLKNVNLWKGMALALGFCLLLSVIMVPMLARAAAGTDQEAGAKAAERTITVSGTADVMVAPDEVDITVGVETRNPDFKKARTENDENVKKVLELTKKYGIDSKYVQTDYIRTFPSYDYQKYTETSQVSYYSVQKRIVVKLKDITKFDAFTSDLMSSGAILIQNIEFRAADMAKYKNEARKLAVKAAKDKASLLTSELGSGIGKPVTISEEQIDNLTWYGSWWGSSWYGYGQSSASLLSNTVVNYQSGPTDSAGGESGETVSIGQIKITAKIGVVFELK